MHERIHSRSLYLRISPKVKLDVEVRIGIVAKLGSLRQKMYKRIGVRREYFGMLCHIEFSIKQSMRISQLLSPDLTVMQKRSKTRTRLPEDCFEDSKLHQTADECTLPSAPLVCKWSSPDSFLSYRLL